MFQPRFFFFSDFFRQILKVRSLGWFAWKKGPLRAFLTKKHAKLIKDVSFLGKERRGIRGSF